MYRGSSKYFKVVRRPEDRYAIWHADARVWGRWRETGRYGSEDECWNYLERYEGESGFLLSFYYEK